MLPRNASGQGFGTWFGMTEECHFDQREKSAEGDPNECEGSALFVISTSGRNPPKASRTYVRDLSWALEISRGVYPGG